MPAIDYFPVLTPRPGQVEAINFIEKAFADGYKDVIIEAPTGFGKSFCASTLCRWLGTATPGSIVQPGGYILVVQKMLQDQMSADLDKFKAAGIQAATLKSSCEYVCPQFKQCNLSKGKCPTRKQGACPYAIAKAQFISSTVGATNYAYYLTDAAHQKFLPTKEVVVMDECHALVSVLTDLAGITVSQKAWEKRDKELAGSMEFVGENLEDFLEWMNATYLPVVYEQLKTFKDLAAEPGATPAEIRMATEAEQEYLHNHAAYKRIESDPAEWIYWADKNQKDGTLTFFCRPLDVAPYFHEFFGKFPRRVYMSAFIGRKDQFCRDLGLNPRTTAHLAIPSTFPPENRPVHLLNVGSLSKNNLEANMPGVLRLVTKIVSKFPNDRGVIHTHSYKIADQVVESLRKAGYGDRLVYPENADGRAEALTEHIKKPGSILISPSMSEGFDFKEEIARFQILIKCPYLSLSSKVVQRKADIDFSWYQMEAAKNILQTVGRAVRSETDTCRNYILDSDVSKLLKNVRKDMPSWFLEAIHES